MEPSEQLQLLKSALAVAMMDGVLTRSEIRMVGDLATRITGERNSLDAILEAAEQGRSTADNTRIEDSANAHTAIELLAAYTVIESKFRNGARDLLVRIAKSLKISGEDFQILYSDRFRRAAELRDSRRHFRA